MSSNKKIVIIGGVAAGPKTAARARRLDPSADITIIERDTYISYAGCGMPFYVAGSVREFSHLFQTSYGVARDEQYFSREKGIKVLTGNEVTDIDRGKKEVLVRNVKTGEESRLSYDNLVIATGSTPFTPPVEGIELKGVYRFNHPEDAKNIREVLDGVQEAVVIGSGLIGMEAAEALREKNIFVTVVELKEQILPVMLDKDLADVLALRLEEQGMEFRLGHKVLKLKGDDGKVTGVVTDQEELDADLVIVAVGVRPNVELAQKAGLTIGRTGAIEVNRYLQTSDPDIYAVGDCVENTHLISGQKVYLPMATYANRQGRVAADNIINGPKSEFKGVLGTAVMKALNWNAGRTGLGEQQARDLGYNVITALNSALDRTHYHPSHGLVLMKLIVDRDSRKVLGAQGIGPGEVVKRIDVAATAISFGATVDDLAALDLAYAPPFSTPIDLAHHTANIVRNKLDGLAKTISVQEAKEKLDRGDDFLIVDVRTPQQFAPKHIDDPRVMQVTLSDIRDRIEEVPKDKEIVALCAMGIRSYEAQRIFEGAGFKDVKYIEGGLQAWPYDLD